jgi:LysM repeat protein
MTVGHSRWLGYLALSLALVVALSAVESPGLKATPVAEHGTQELTHRVRSGESASSIARDYYGDLSAGELLLLYNNKASNVIHAGETLRIPYTSVHTVKAGDAWSAIAQIYLQRPAAYATIARLNGLPPEKPLQIGTPILIPAIFLHELQRGETLNLLADRFYGDQTRSSVLQEFNGIDDPRRLSPGRSLRIPIISLQLIEDRKSTPTAKTTQPDTKVTSVPRAVATSESHATTVTEPSPAPTTQTPTVSKAESSGPAKTTQRSKTVTPPPAPKPVATTDPGEPATTTVLNRPEPRFTAELLDAERTFRLGDYTRAREKLEALRNRISAEGTAKDQAELWRQLTFVYVAFDLKSEACVAYGSFRRNAADASFDPDLVSPKIRRVVDGC